MGRKPGSYSFPSGHSAAAFAGALLLAREYPGGARGFFGLATLVAFSRIYSGRALSRRCPQRFAAWAFFGANLLARLAQVRRGAGVRDARPMLPTAIIQGLQLVLLLSSQEGSVTVRLRWLSFMAILPAT